jgi:hypothetical protein
LNASGHKRLIPCDVFATVGSADREEASGRKVKLAALAEPAKATLRATDAAVRHGRR